MEVSRVGFANRSTMRMISCCVKRRGMSDYKKASDRGGLGMKGGEGGEEGGLPDLAVCDSES